MELEDRKNKFEPLDLAGHFAEAKTKEALRLLILQRFAGWLDDVLAEEKPLDGIAAELLAELHDKKESDAAGPNEGVYDRYSTWSAMTALIQEIKLQGRTFKQLSEKMAPFAGLEASIGQLLATHHEALSDARRIAEDGRSDRDQRESKLKLEAHDRARRELIGVFIEIRDSLLIGLRSAAESQRKLQGGPDWSRLKNLFSNKSAAENHKLEIVNSLKKGYRMGLDRIDEALQQLGVTEIVCEGKPFDPRITNAVDIEETDGVPDGTVLEVYRTGYMIDTDVLRSAEVKVARVPEQKT